jgi:hypothetical protein
LDFNLNGSFFKILDVGISSKPEKISNLKIISPTLRIMETQSNKLVQIKSAGNI